MLTYYELGKKNVVYLAYLEGEFQQVVYLDKDNGDIILEVEEDIFEIINNFGTTDNVDAIIMLKKEFENVVE